MKRNRISYFFFFVFLALAAVSLQGQSTRSEQESAFKDRIWWGGGFALGFSSFNNVTNIQLGISPMAGYKFTDRFSAAPRVSVLMSYFSARLFNGDRANEFTPTWAVGAFTRYKLIRDIFAHAEYEFENRAFVTSDLSALYVNRRNVNNVYIGAGYNSGGAEFVVLYNLNQEAFLQQSPFVFRFGFTRNF
ncbi:MAG: hypothetical protein IPK21_19940 [Haliscomenobacter sp.]|nr:hypothetical protein [Haliscomenobacter sp.]